MIYLCFQFSIENATNTEMAQPCNGQNTVQLRITKKKNNNNKRFNHENDELRLVHTYDVSMSIQAQAQAQEKLHDVNRGDVSTSTRKIMCEPAGKMLVLALVF